MEKAMVVVIILLLSMVTTNGLEIKYLRGISLDDAEKQSVVDKGIDRGLGNNVNRDLIEDENKEDRKSFDLEQPSIAVIGETDLMKKYPNMAKSILQRSKCPSLKILLDLSSECNRSARKCNTRKYRRQIEKWSIPQPFYVDEPRWVEIELDYEENLPYYFNNEKDSFFVTRGKKIFRPKIEEQDFSKANENNREKFLEKSNEEFIEDTKIKRNESKRKEERRKAIELGTRQLEELIRNFERTEEPFVLTRGKKLHVQNREYSTLDENLKKETLETKLLEKIKKRSVINGPTYYMTMINKNTSSFLNRMNNVTLSKEQYRLRTKRNSCENLACHIDDSKKIRLMKNLERAISDSEQKDKRSDIYDIFEEPFVISKNKKKSKSIDQRKSRIVPIDYDESFDSLETAKHIIQRLIDSRICTKEQCKNIMKFIMENDMLMTNRDRRNVLDELLRKYDQFYVVKGKRIYSSNSLEEDRLKSNVD
ncbi:uncharacterized protein LOC118440342 [Vespa mandarinia]|uniref:uncharacterized protein LOC118440342 n=1 Tax=Vespa mandarinia TaxID=7446 RepID=UPI001620818C|nr:uncharacterized protein LOC118440342 [Vespa mandarinia]